VHPQRRTAKELRTIPLGIAQVMTFETVVTGLTLFVITHCLLLNIATQYSFAKVCVVTPIAASSDRSVIHLVRRPSSGAAMTSIARSHSG
jgi:hypothetical protein